MLRKLVCYLPIQCSSIRCQERSGWQETADDLRLKIDKMERDFNEVYEQEKVLILLIFFYNLIIII